MKLKVKRFSVFLLTVLGVILNACGSKFIQSTNLAPSPTFLSFTTIPTLTITPTLNQIDYLNSLLTTSPTRYPLPTLPPNCGTISLGNSGTQTIDNAKKILVQGTAILCGEIYIPIIGSHETIKVLEGLIDLDSGTLNEENADFWFCPGGGSMIFYYVCDFNNSELKKYRYIFENGKTIEPKQPSFEECSGIDPYTGIDSDEAKYVCVITTLGNVSRIKIEKFDPLDNVMSIEISFVTWEK